MTDIRTYILEEEIDPVVSKSEALRVKSKILKQTRDVYNVKKADYRKLSATIKERDKLLNHVPDQTQKYLVFLRDKSKDVPRDIPKPKFQV